MDSKIGWLIYELLKEIAAKRTVIVVTRRWPSRAGQLPGLERNELQAATEDPDRSVCRAGLLEMRAEAPSAQGGHRGTGS
ncbi:MAG TPA: hypothetical protein VHE78_06565, partial [Gemmatimonadaceae bacterium]|nr:hypothetical protein [Gemmatimonadaceae bacterium]